MPLQRDEEANVLESLSIRRLCTWIKRTLPAVRTYSNSADCCPTNVTQGALNYRFVGNDERDQAEVEMQGLRKMKFVEVSTDTENRRGEVPLAVTGLVIVHNRFPGASSLIIRDFIPIISKELMYVEC